LNTNWRVRLIKTDDIDVSAGVVTIGGSSAVSYNNLVVTTLSITSSSQITGLGCEMNADSRSIDVRLPTSPRLILMPHHPTGQRQGENLQYQPALRQWREGQLPG
jgi:type 1 fimbria pilin